MVPFERHSYGHPLAGLLWERKIEEVLFEKGWEEVPTWVCLHVHTKIRLFSSVFVDDIKKVGKKQNKNSMSKIMHKEIDLGDQTPLSDQVCLGCKLRMAKVDP